MIVIRTQAEIDEQLNRCEERVEKGKTFRAHSYEEGAIAMYRWLRGEEEDPPISDEDLE